MKRNLHAGKRMSGGFSINVFTDDELYEIHLATLEVLGKTGLFVEDEEALNIFGDHGAIIDRKSKIAKLPPYLVEDAVRSAPPRASFMVAMPGMTLFWRASGSTSPILGKPSMSMTSIRASTGLQPSKMSRIPRCWLTISIM